MSDPEVEKTTEDNEAPQDVENPVDGEEREPKGCCGCKFGGEKNDIYKDKKEDGSFYHLILDNTSRSACYCLGTDWPALLVFAAAVLAVFVLWILAFQKGQVAIALYGMAWNGNICGHGANIDAPYQVWVNPTATGSLFGTSVCMPSCPTINGTVVTTTNDTATIATVTSAVDSLADGTSKTQALAALGSLDNRVEDLKSEVTYMQAQLGDTANELDRSSIFCLCNRARYGWTTDMTNAGSFLHYQDSTHNISAMCSASPADARGYIELPYSDAFAIYVGDTLNLALDSAAMEKVPCAFKYRTERTFTRCMPWISANALGRVTMVMGTSGVSDGVSSAYNAASQRLVAICSDIEKGHTVMYICIGLALLLSIGLIYAMSCSCWEGRCALLSWIVWGTLITMGVFLGCVTAVCAYQFKFYKDRFDTTPELSTKAEDEQSMYVYGVSMAGFGIAFLAHTLFISPCCCMGNINRGITIIMHAANVFNRLYMLMLYPLFHNLALLIAIICWLVGLLFMATAGEKFEQVANGTDIGNAGVYTLQYDENFQRAMAYYFVMIIWIVEFMGATGFMIIAAAILIVYFDDPRSADDGGTPRKWPTCDAFRLILCNHLGTAAFGSFFITLVVVIRLIVTYFLYQLQQNNKSEWVKYFVACVEACCQCIEDCMRYMVNTAYIVTVMDGSWFFSAVCHGLWALIKNAGTVMATNYIAFLILWLCKLSVPLGVTSLAWVMIESGKFGCNQYDFSSTFNVLVPIFVISAVFSFTFMGLLGQSIDVILLAFLKKEEIQAEHGVELQTSSVGGNMEEHIKTARSEGDDAEAKADGTGEGQPLVSETEKDSSCC